MRSFTILALPALAVAFVPVNHAGGPQGPPTIPGSLYPTNGSTNSASTQSYSTPTGNLSITKTTSTTSTTSQSVVLITTSQSGGGPLTVTSYVGATSAPAATTSGTIGQTQPGAAAKVGGSTFGALALAVGMGAFFL